MTTTKVSKLNLGCGQCKLDGYLNVDIDEALNPDAVVDLTKPFPFGTNEFEEVLFFHTIEHLPKHLHPTILSEIHRVLQLDGKLILGYPEFKVCAEYWLSNKQGKRDFWEACIFGRQLSTSDYHVSLMNSDEVKDLLLSIGFKDIKVAFEPGNEQYALVTAIKSVPRPTYAEYIKTSVFGD